jgi:hypothetical protein
MAKNLTDLDSYGATITVPEGTDSRDDAAGDVELFAQQLANRTKYLKGRADVAAYRNSANTFAGNQSVTGTVNVSGNISSLAGNLYAVLGDVNAGADVIAGVDVKAGRHVIADDDVVAGAAGVFRYPTQLARVTAVNLRHGAVLNDSTFFLQANGIWKANSNPDYGTDPNKGALWVPIELPADATLTRVRVVTQKTGSGNTIELMLQYGANGTTTETFAGWSGYTATGGHTHEVVPGGGGLVIVPTTQYVIRVVAQDTDDSVYSVLLDWLDPGPRNY